VADSLGPFAGVVLALDVDGVLLDSASDERGHWMAQFTSRFGVDAEQLRDALFFRRWPDIIVGRRSVEAGLVDVFAELGWDIDIEDALSCWFDADFFVNEEVVSAVNEWASQGARLVLATDQERRRVAYLEPRLAPLVPFAGIAYSGQLGHVKEEAQFYRDAELFLGIPSSEAVVFLDDRIENVKVAQRHGWLGFHFEKGDRWRTTVEGLLLEASRKAP
jgi:FMN phosphatase YigB (HAD superfamily)